MRKVILAALAAVLWTGGSTVSAAPILSVDFGRSDPSNSALQSGFSGFWLAGNTNTANPSQVFGAYTVQVFGATVTGRDRNGPTDLLRDLLTSINRQLVGTGGQIGSNVSASIPTLQVSGLQANTPYEVRVWSQDNSFNNGDTTTWFSDFLTTQLGSNIVNATGRIATDITSVNDYSAVGTVTSNASGQISLWQRIAKPGATGDNNGMLNALQITAVPEPGSLGALAGLAMLVLRRRR